MGGDKIVKYLDFVGYGLGFNTVHGCCVTACDPMTAKEKQKIDKAVADLSDRFCKTLMKPPYPVPPLLKLWGFRMGRTSIRLMLDDTKCDYRYYKERGWFDADYYYPTHLGPVKRMAGHFFDSMATKRVTKR